MDTKEILRVFDVTGALQNGHFLLTSGLHSPTYFQAAVMLQYPEYLEKFAEDIVQFFREEDEIIDVVLSPAIGGIVVGQEVGRQLGVRSIFAERVDGHMRLRRGFHLKAKENVLIIEDVVTTGGTVEELVKLAEASGAYVAGAACVVDRSDGEHGLEVPLYSVYSTKVIAYKAENCPLCKQGVPITKPGSREDS